MTSPKDATTRTVGVQESFRAGKPMDWQDKQDHENATRGFVARPADSVVTTGGGDPVWSLEGYEFLDGEAPPTVNPSLWRQAKLNMESGMFTIAPRIHQLRGFDLSEITIIEGDTGLIVIDPLISTEAASAAMSFAREHLGDRPVVAVIHTHSHVDHFGGIKGVISQEDVDSGRCRVIAPIGMVEAAVSENVFAGPAMSRRAQYMYGAKLDRSAKGQVDAGLGKTNSTGTVTLILPTDIIGETGDELTIDGVKIEFQLTPGTEAPAEMNFYFPQFRALCMAENCSRNLHNLYTLRGAQVRDALAWSRYMDESLLHFDGKVDLLFTSHHWPVWGQAAANEYMGAQRDVYKFLHDQTLKLANQGYTMTECAEILELPDALARHWCNRPYYGTVSHNVKAVYQRYLGWFSGNPSELHALPEEAAAAKYVEYMGGANQILAKARVDFESGEYRWVAEVLNRVVFADEANTEAREMLADAYEQLGYQAESAPWRNFYLVGATELRNGVAEDPGEFRSAGADVAMAMDVSMLFDAIALRINASACAGEELKVNVRFSDIHEQYCLFVENSVFHHRRGLDDAAVATVTLTKIDFLSAIAGFPTGNADIQGDENALARLMGWLDRTEGNFPIVTP